MALRIMAVPAAHKAALELEEALHRDDEDAWRETAEQRWARIIADPIHIDRPRGDTWGPAAAPRGPAGRPQGATP